MEMNQISNLLEKMSGERVMTEKKAGGRSRSVVCEDGVIDPSKVVTNRFVRGQ